MAVMLHWSFDRVIQLFRDGEKIKILIVRVLEIPFGVESVLMCPQERLTSPGKFAKGGDGRWTAGGF